MKKPSAPPLFATPEDVESAFYDALFESNLDTLMAVWSEDEEISCVHPTGQIFSGLQAIRDSWQRIMEVTKRLKINLQHLAQWQSMLMAVHQIVESFVHQDETVGYCLVTHVYMRGPYGWRLVCRHVSSFFESAQSGKTTANMLH